MGDLSEGRVIVDSMTSLSTAAYWALVIALTLPLALALLAWATAKYVIHVAAMMSADAFLNAMWFPLVGTLSGAFAGIGFAQSDESGARRGQTSVDIALMLVLVVSPLVAALLRRRISLTPMHPDSHPARQRERRHLTEQLFISPAEHAWFLDRAENLQEKASGLLARRDALTLRAYAASRSRACWILCAGASIVGTAGIVLTASLAGSPFYMLGLIAVACPALTLLVNLQFDRRALEVEAREFHCCAEFITAQLKYVLPAESPKPAPDAVAGTRARPTRAAGALALVAAGAAAGLVMANRAISSR